MNYFAHELALVEEGAEIGEGSRIWQFAHVRSGATLGEECTVAKGVFVDTGVRIGRAVKIQNHVSVYQGVELADGVFVGPHVSFTNDKHPRAIHPDGSPRQADEWVVTPTYVDRGASIGAGAVIVAGVELGAWCMIAAGTVVTKNVPPHALVVGNPGRICGVVDHHGVVIQRPYEAGTFDSSQGEPVVVEPGWVQT